MGQQTVRIYRVESRVNGTGPYQNYHTPLATSTKRHPSPYDDGIAPWQVREESLFGFESLIHLVRWFDKSFRSDIIVMGKEYGNVHEYDIVVYSVPKNEVVPGGHQMVFNREYAERLGAIPLPLNFTKKITKELLAI